MGNADSTQKLGERVLAGKAKLEQVRTDQSSRYAYLKNACPEILDQTVESIRASFQSCAPFLEPTLMLAWMHDAEQCKQIVLECCRKVLSAPIQGAQFKWFKEYVFTSSIWMFETTQNKYMYQELLQIAKDMSHDIINSMDSIYELLTAHKKWKEVLEIKNDDVILRQDNERVGLLRDKGFRRLFEQKTDDEQALDMKSYIDTNLAINILTSTATMINPQFQNHVKTVMGHHGTFKPGPIKKVDRCVSKLENDYSREAFPKSARLLDLVRCSVTFNTVDQLLEGYQALRHHVDQNPSMVELARIKNGFLDKGSGGYRDIKVCLLYKSQIDENLKMICEIQLLLINYLEEKKRIHKLYSIVREEIYFQMVVQDQTKSAEKSVTDLKFTDALDVKKEVTFGWYKSNLFGKSSVDSESGLLAMEGENWFGIIHMEQKKTIFEVKRDSPTYPWYARVSHAWIVINGQKYISVQMNKTEIKMYKVVTTSDESYEFVEDEKYGVKLTDGDLINYCAFDKAFTSLLLVVNYNNVQKRSMEDVNKITVNIKLQENIEQSSFAQLNFTSDGSLCALGGGAGKSYFYVIDMVNEKQHKLTSAVLSDTYAPCFINGENKFLSVGDKKGRVEIWDFQKKESFKLIKIGAAFWMPAAASAHNILAIGSLDKKLRLYDVTNWECFYVKECGIRITQLHLTHDLQYLTMAGTSPSSQYCAYVMNIE